MGDVNLEIVESGPGGRPLLLVHGFGGAKENLAERLDELAAAGWHAVAPDLRGHGSSDHPEAADAYEPATMMGDLLGLADALGWNRFALVGHSLGGGLAQLLVLQQPGRVEALVLMSTFCGPVRDLEPDLVALGTAIVRQGGMEALAAALAARRASDPVAEAARRRMEAIRPGHGARADRQLLACSATMWLALAPRFLDWPPTDGALAALAVPTLVVTGSDDQAMRADCERLAQVIPGARLAIIPGVGHSPHLEAADRCWAEIGEFLGGVTVNGESPARAQ